jgi:nucleoside-diphosphate-sugar epimerase
VRVLVAGASGFIGRNLLEALDPDWEVVALWRGAAMFPEAAAALGRPRLRAVRCDLTDAAAVAACAPLAQTFDIVFNLAGRVDIPRSLTEAHADLQDNATATLNLTRTVTTKHLVHVSTGAVYEGQSGKVDPSVPLAPSLPYAAHKLLGEYYARAAHARFGTAAEVTIVRFFGAYGPHEPAWKLYAKLVQRFARERTPSFEVYGDGTNLIDGMWAEDAAQGLLRIGLDARPGRPPVWVVDFAGGRPVTVSALVKLAGAVLLGRDVTVTCCGIANERNAFFGDPEPLASALGVRAFTPLEEGLARYAALRRPSL